MTYEPAQENSLAKSVARFPRRTFLRGVGVTMALPWLESLPALGGSAMAAAAAEQRGGGGGVPEALCRHVHGQRRESRPLVGQGRRARRWSWAKRLQPLEPIKCKINVIHGLFNKSATGHGHSPGA